MTRQADGNRADHAKQHDGVYDGPSGDYEGCQFAGHDGAIDGVEQVRLLIALVGVRVSRHQPEGIERELNKFALRRKAWIL